MTRQPGDPRSADSGDQPFDMTEYPGPPPAPVNPPPMVPNVLGYVPYRGSEQHGVPLAEPGAAYLPYLSEDLAHQRHTDPTVSPRDIEPMKPVPVMIVEVPNLIQPRHARFSSYAIAPSATYNWIKIVQPERLRKKCIVTVCGSAGGSGTVRISSYPGGIEPNSALVAWGVNDTETLVDTEANSSLYAWVITSSDATATVSVRSEYYEYDGVPLL